MTRLKETTVQIEALHYLRNKYRYKARMGRIFAQPEMRTKRTYGGKRADGLIAYKKWWGGVEVVAIEAKSSRTLQAIKPVFKLHWFIWNCIRAGLIVMVATGAIFAIYKSSDFTFQLLIPLNIFGAGMLLYGLLTFNSYRHCDVPVIDQIRQYPANEQWLAFSKDSFNDLSKKKQRQLKKICSAKGVGILIVTKRGRVKRWVKADRKSRIWGDYLTFYSAESGVRREL